MKKKAMCCVVRCRPEGTFVYELLFTDFPSITVDLKEALDVIQGFAAQMADYSPDFKKALKHYENDIMHFTVDTIDKLITGITLDLCERKENERTCEVCRMIPLVIERYFVKRFLDALNFFYCFEVGERTLS